MDPIGVRAVDPSASVINLSAWRVGRVRAALAELQVRWPCRWAESTLIAAEGMPDIFEGESDDDRADLLDLLQRTLREPVTTTAEPADKATRRRTPKGRR